MIYELNDKKPIITESVFLAPGSVIVGDVEIKDNSSIWYNAVLRGDVSYIKVGENSNIQENCSLHVDFNQPLIIKNNVTVGHGVILHGCTINNNCLIGMGATILNNANIGENTIIGAGALVTENKEIPPNSLVLGVPGKVVRQLSKEEIKKVQDGTEHYIKLSAEHKNIVKKS